MDNIYVSPTEFASISGVSRQTLIFYEKKGIFLPAYKNEKGYRFYLMSQLDIIATIQSLQKIGLSLEETKIILNIVMLKVRMNYFLIRLIL